MSYIVHYKNLVLFSIADYNMEQEPMDVETKVYKEVCESTLLCLISAHGYEKPLNTNDQDQKVTPLVGHCPCGDCHAKNESCPMETDNDCVSDVNDKKVLVKETQTELTWCPNYDIYSCSFVSKEDINAFKLQCLLEKLFLEKTQKVFECNGTTSQFIYNAKDVQRISEMCSGETVQQLVHHKCEVMSFCYDVVDGKIDSDRELLMACIHVLELAILHDKNVCQTVADTRQSIHLKLCLLFDNLEEDNEKQLFIRIFRNVVKQALTIDDEVFQRMVYRGCSVLSTRNEPLLLEGVLFLDAAVELYQEWDIHTMLLNNSVFPIIVSLLSHSNYEMKVKAMRMLGNLLSLVHLNINWAVIKGGIMNHLLVFLLSDDPELVKQSLWLLSNVNAGPKGSTKTMVHFGLISVVLKHMQSGCAHVAIEALYVIANLIEDASPKMRTVLLKDKEILTGLIFCLQVSFLRILFAFDH